jgi:hypothetical protein
MHLGDLQCDIQKSGGVRKLKGGQVCHECHGATLGQYHSREIVMILYYAFCSNREESAV